MSRPRSTQQRPEYRGNRINYRVEGAPLRPLSDLYHHLMSGSWWRGFRDLLSHGEEITVDLRGLHRLEE